MVSSEYTDRQKFETKEGALLTSQRSHPCSIDSEERYLLWSDIQQAFQGIDHLETESEERVLFTIDADGELWQPLRIRHDSYRIYVVIYGINQRQQTEESYIIPQECYNHGHIAYQNRALGEIQSPLGDLFDTCIHLYQSLETAADGEREPFRQAATNARYYHSKFMEEVKRLDKAGASTLVDGKSQVQMLEELHDLEQQLPEWEYQSACRSILCDKNNNLSYATSSIFLALPSDLDSWDGPNTSTHQFRLYFMCDHWKQEDGAEDIPQHVHVSNHPGYILKRQQEFFQTYGDYVLRMLHMTKLGHSNEYYEIPPLETLRILWGCDPDVIGSHINKDTIGLLIDKAINYLQELSPPKWTTTLTLDRDQNAAIKTFLDIQDDPNSDGNLSRFIGPFHNVYWICHAHVHQYTDNESLERLRMFVQSHGGRIDMQQAQLDVELGSPAEAELFRTLLKGCRHRFDIFVKLTWNASRSCVKKLCTNITATGAMVLKVDGVTIDIDSQGYDRSLRTVFNISTPRFKRLRFITLLNYPRPQKQSILLDKYLLQSVEFSARSPHSWVELRDDLYGFGRKVSVAQDPSDWITVATLLQSTLAKHGVRGADMVVMYSDGWSAAFDPTSGAVVKVHSLDTVSLERILSAKTITSLGVHVNGLRFDKGFFCAVRTNVLLQELDVSYLGYNVLYYTGHIIKTWHTSACSCRFTLLDRVEGAHDRVVAQLTIKGSNRQSPRNGILDVDGCDIDGPISQQQVSGALVDFVLDQWDCDHVLSALSDYSASLLDMATKQHPLVLTIFTLDVSQLSRVGLSSIREVFSRSNLEKLHIVCSPVDSLSRSIAQILGSVQWNTLKSLSLSGDNIDEWCQLWPSPVFPRLLSLQIQGSSSAIQKLSHSSVLFLQQLIFSSPLMEIYLRNVLLQDKHDWVLVIDSMDFSFLQTLDLGEQCAMQFLSVPEAIDLFVSGLEAIHVETEGRTLVLPSFTLDTTTLTPSDLARVQMILCYCMFEKLVVKCDRIDLNMSYPVAKMLDSVQWASLEHLVLSGDNINQWIQLLATANTPRLKTLQIWGTKLVVQELSHASVLSVERLIGTNSLMELYFKDIVLQDQRDWVLLVETMDSSMLDDFGLGGDSYDQFMGTPDAVDLEYSKRVEWKRRQHGIIEE